LAGTTRLICAATLHISQAEKRIVMRAETEKLVEEIKQSIELLRRSL
jgi:hypothetical protein